MTTQAGRILVVDDEANILEFVSYNLKRAGHEVTTAATGAEALRLADERSFDLVILDVMLPGPDGLEVCRRLRQRSQVPVLFLSARDSEVDKVVGLEMGGDDYLAKPFGVHELLARVKALLRRARAGAAQEPGQRRLEAGGIVLDEATHAATAGGKTLDLTPREFELLASLMREPGRVLTRNQLLEQAWGWQVVVETKTVDTHVKRLRDKLAAAGADPSAIETVRGYGYRMRR